MTEGRPYPYMIHQLMEQTRVMNVKRVCKVGDSVRDIQEGRPLAFDPHKDEPISIDFLSISYQFLCLFLSISSFHVDFCGEDAR